MGTLFSTAALQALPELQEYVESVVLISPVAAGAALTWELTLYGGYTPALPPLSELVVDGVITARDLKLKEEALRYYLWSLAAIGAVNPTLAPYSLPPYEFGRLVPPAYPNGFPADTLVGVATSTSPADQLDITVASQQAALSSWLFERSDGTSTLDFLASIWSRSHSYDATVVAWSNGVAAAGGANVRILCAYGVAVTTDLTTSVDAPRPFPLSVNDPYNFVGFRAIRHLSQVDGPGDGIVNLQGSNGCDRMADATGGQVFTSTSQDCEHIQIVENGPGAQALLNEVMTAAGVDVFAGVAAG